MTRTQNERLAELEAEQALVNQKLDSQGEKLDVLARKQEEQAARLAEIAESLAAIAKAMVPPAKSPSTTIESGSSAHIATAFTDEGGPRSASTTLLPSFDGEDPIGWLARVEQQFELNRTPPDRQIAAARVSMEGAALYWVTWLKARKPGISWEEFKQALVARFDS
ncbi:unnamed protein product [Cuscuta epithymum]|uniref:Retrotransposon gag domain-containing protein n=1 Tax=Cuscuta epithymum TaxID=186058 RepID=A0AAV0CXF9_9ASTE|nr:unnamed protein product [Cuscuta epithymum]